MIDDSLGGGHYPVVCTSFHFWVDRSQLNSQLKQTVSKAPPKRQILSLTAQILESSLQLIFLFYITIDLHYISQPFSFQPHQSSLFIKIKSKKHCFLHYVSLEFPYINFLSYNHSAILEKLYRLFYSLQDYIIIFLMHQQVKLVVAQTLEGEQQQFYILNNVILGKGGYGVVKKATTKDTTREYAVKIIPYNGDEKKVAKYEKEVNILRILPDNRHLVRVLPFKCYSQNNFYIFMEMCKDGTLHDYLIEKSYLSEEKILNIFWQLFSGYRVLWENRIVHHDLKLANVLIKDGVLKIADFGFSILKEKYVPSGIREGTMQYMPPQKFNPNYEPDEKTDVYALGVMMYELIAKQHPYVNNKPWKDYKEYLGFLRNADLVIPGVVSQLSAPTQKLFDLIVRMVARNPKNRVMCQQIYDYIDNQEIFAPHRAAEADKTKEIVLDPLNLKLVDVTKVYVVPFPVQPEEEKEYVDKIKNQVQIMKNEENRKIIAKVEQWILSLRLAVYFFDRLARRLFVEKLRGNFSAEKNHAYNNIILGCFLTEKKITRWVLQQLKHPQEFTKDEISVFKGSDQGKLIIGIIKRDELYIDEEITDNLKRTNQVNPKEQKELIDLAEKDEFFNFISIISKYFKDCIAHKASLIHSRNDLITMVYLIDGLKILAPLPVAAEKLSLEEYFYSTETKPQSALYTCVEAYLKGHNIESNISEEIYAEESNLAIK